MIAQWVFLKTEDGFISQYYNLLFPGLSLFLYRSQSWLWGTNVPFYIIILFCWSVIARSCCVHSHSRHLTLDCHWLVQHCSPLQCSTAIPIYLILSNPYKTVLEQTVELTPELGAQLSRKLPGVVGLEAIM
jgi:hypothetical protein